MAGIENWLEDNPQWFDYPVTGNPAESGMVFDVEVVELGDGASDVSADIPRPEARPAGG